MIPRRTPPLDLSSAARVSQAVATRKAAGMPAGASVRLLAEGEGWRITDMVCTAAPGDTAFEEQHDYVSIALVAAGAFTFRDSAGASHLFTGSVLLGSPGSCFTCGHEHGEGDRCIAVHYSPDHFERILASLGRPRRGRTFPRNALPASRASAGLIAQAEALERRGSVDEAYDLALRVVEWTENQLSEGAPSPLLAAQAKAVLGVVRAIEADITAEHTLSQLSSSAGLSAFHFLRLFRRIVGMTPHAYVRTLRAREAARLLCDPRQSISAIAFEVGFQDLSVFNTAFRDTFGMTPSAMRNQRRLS